ncbi:phosphoadenylyl-sulfate reductase [Hydrogenimonas sp.]
MREISIRAEAYNNQFNTSEPEEILRYFLNIYEGTIALATSFGAEDQVLTHICTSIDPECEIFTLDTGRLPEETYRVWERTERLYGIRIRPLVPEQDALERLLREQGINGFYESIEKRKRCCEVRKIDPLRRALAGKDVWITGLRREQSVTRSDAKVVEYDEQFGLIKINPLLGWSTQRVWAYIREHEIPYNELHDRGYPSIGCAPCTRAVAAGEDIRSGRWWWESPEHKECGLHLKKRKEEKEEATHE